MTRQTLSQINAPPIDGGLREDMSSNYGAAPPCTIDVTERENRAQIYPSITLPIATKRTASGLLDQ